MTDPPRPVQIAGPKPKWAEGNPLVTVHTCSICLDQWWEHDHSLATTLQHLQENHPGWDATDSDRGGNST